MEIQSYREVVDRILSIPKFTKEKHGFEVIRSYLEALGHPERGIQVIHVAGTNGKGSVTRMLAGLLGKTGKRTGAFYSPHLVRMNERIQVNAREISDEALVSVFRAVEEVREERHFPQLTFFELLFVMAMVHFHEEQVDCVVLETGLGGRLDATTSIPAELYVITQVGLDHEEYLGHTIPEVAGEKAGIITGSSPVVWNSGSEEADRVIRDRIERMGASPAVNAGNARIRDLRISPSGIDFSIKTDYYSYDLLHLDTLAVYQVDNAATVICAAELLLQELREKDPQGFIRLIREMLQDFRWEGRLTEVRPGLWLDGAHNPSAATRLAESVKELQKLHSGERLGWRLVYGASADKNMEETLRQLATVHWDELWLVPYTGARSAAEEVLEFLGEKVMGETVKITAFPEVSSMLKRLKEEEGHTCTIVAGSLYLVGEIRGSIK